MTLREFQSKGGKAKFAAMSKKELREYQSRVAKLPRKKKGGVMDNNEKKCSHCGQSFYGRGDVCLACKESESMTDVYETIEKEAGF